MAPPQWITCSTYSYRGKSEHLKSQGLVSGYLICNIFEVCSNYAHGNKMPEAGVTCFTYAYIGITCIIFKSVTTMPKAFTISITSLTCAKFVFVAMFLGCTSTGRVGLCFCGSMSRNSRRLNRQCFWF